MISPRKKRSTIKITIECFYCKIKFNVPNYRKDTTKYCSKKCMGLYARIKIKMNCKVCNNEFEHISSRSNKAKYCSKKCYYKSQLKQGTREYKCHYCEKIFLDAPSHKRKYCSIECNRKENKKIWKAVFSTVRKNMLRRGMLEKCQLCGFSKYKEIIGVHHIDGNRHNNDLSNLMVLCPNCHSIQHKKHIVHAK